LLLVALIHRHDIGARWMTLEVRASNALPRTCTASTLKEMGVRRRYYSDNGEDALVMWTDALDSDSFTASFEPMSASWPSTSLGPRYAGSTIWSLNDGYR